MASNFFATKLFFPKDKRALFLMAFEQVLVDTYKIIPTFGPPNKQKTCELKFKFINCMGRKLPSEDYEAKKAKMFIQKNLYILEDLTNVGRKIDTSSTDVEIIYLDDEITPVSPPIKKIDLTEPEPEIIILDEIKCQANKTRNEIDVVDIIELDHSTSAIENSESENQTLSLKKRSISTCRPSMSDCDSEIKIIGSSKQRKKKRQLRNLSRLIQKKNVHLSPVHRNKIPSNLHKPKVGLSTKKLKKLQDVGNIMTVTSSSIGSPNPKPLSGSVTSYYSHLEGILRKSKKNSKSKKSPLQTGTPLANHLRGLSSMLKKNKKQKQSEMKELQGRLPTLFANEHHQQRLNPRTKLFETNIFNPHPHEVEVEGLRPVVIDGSNVAVGHGKGKFSAYGVKICVDYFATRGHNHVKVFLPKFRQECFSEELLTELRSKCDMVFTPSMNVHGIRKTPYDDRFIVQYAVEFGGVIVSTDNYRDLLRENPRWRNTIEQRLLMFTWVDDFLMFPLDPLGRNGPTLEQFLRF